MIGMAGRFPGARSVTQFWENLVDGYDAVTEVPPERWDWREYFDPDPAKPGRTYCRWGGFLDGADEFDNAFFRIAPAEAEVTDPQQRLFLQTCWHALDDAGYAGDRAGGLRCGVMAGALENDFGQRLRADENSTRVAQGMLGNAPSILAARIAYFLDLKGPAVCINTACSSSLAAVHLGCQSLRNRETDMMLVGGVSLYPDEGPFILMSKAGMLSHSGRCHTFDAEADGIVVGEAVAALVLKRLADAERDGDSIYGVIAGSGTNQDGTTNGLTAPNGDAQRDLAVEVMRRANIAPAQVSYIECHGTGTKLGDPVEVRGIVAAYGDGQQCALGSAKSSVGHTSAAAGVVSLVKVLLALRHKQIPPTLHVRNLNPLLGIDGSRFQVNTHLSQWRQVDGDRVAAVNSFGYSGTNAYALVTEGPKGPVSGLGNDDGPFLVPLSAFDAAGLARLKADVAEWLLVSPAADNSPIRDILVRALSLPAGTLAGDTRLDEIGWDAHQIAATARELENQLGVPVSPTILAGADTVAALEKRLARRTFRQDMAAISAAFQCDRAALPHRAAFVAASVEELHAQLFTSTEPQWPAPPNATPEQLFREQDWAGLASAWEAGARIGWRSLWLKVAGGLPARRARLLPPYPFQPRRFALPQKSAVSTGIATQGGPHRSRFDPDLRKDHRILGDAVLPGAAMLIAAMTAAHKVFPGTSLEDFLWLRPCTEDAIEADCEGETLAVRASSGVVHAQCWVTATRSALADDRGPDELAVLQQGGHRRIDGQAVYDLFDCHGLSYGDSLRILKEVSVCQDGVLARIAVPDPHDCGARFVDGAFQAVLATFGENEGGAHLPFSLESAVWEALPQTGYAWVVRQHEMASPTFDIWLLDDRGSVRGRLRGLSLRPLSEPAETVFVDTSWERRTRSTPASERDQRWLLRGFSEQESGAIRVTSPAAVDVLDETGDQSVSQTIVVRSTDANSSVLGLLRTGATLNRQQTSRLVVVVDRGTTESPNPIHAAVRSLALEYPGLSCGVVELDFQDRDWAQALTAELTGDGADAVVRYESGRREVLAIRQASGFVAHPQTEARKTWLITGATGGLGGLAARHLASRGPVNLVLTGRRSLDDAVIAELRSAGAEVTYRTADLGDESEVARLVQHARSEFGAVQGWIHAAGESDARQAVGKDAESVAAVLTPKITGAALLTEALRDEPVERIVLFSSIAGLFGDLGQADYAFANAWIDRYAEKMGPVAVSVRWPLCVSGGMRIPNATREFLQNSYGLIPLPDDGFCRVLDYAIAGGRRVITPLYGDKQKIQRLLSSAPAPLAVSNECPVGVPSTQVAEILCNCVAEITHIPRESIDVQADLREFGLDSIGYTELSTRLSKTLGVRATPAIFFDARNLIAVARAVENMLPQRPAEPTGIAEQPPSPTPSTVAVQEAVAEDPAVAPSRDDAIAIIGMSGRYPGSANLAEYWRHLQAGDDLVDTVQPGRWKSDEALAYQGGFLSDIASFDAKFFGISPREAMLMDPQQRLFLETVWSTIESAGYRPSALAGTDTAIFVGVANMDYANLMARAGVDVETHATTGVSHAILANRVSFLLDLRGPSEPIDTACSSSLVAVHRAAEAIRSGSCEQAIAGGVNVLLSEDLFVSFAKAGMLSPSGRCRTFDAAADGYVRGEGVGAVFLKPLHAALCDGDEVLAVIRGSGENHNGRANGLTAPNGESQSALLAKTYQRAGVDPASVTYVEAHGSATPIGDPIECNALRDAYAHLRAARGAAELPAGSCGLGSVKSNIGHLETAAGIAGLHKVVLALQHRYLPATRNVENVNPYLQLEVASHRWCKWSRA
ncbi:SDR family NAD(P)-dependent oxidoreductase [Mycobacterium sp.]|uniref:SDR family NAD(P)-dependent oxidoreductase n=1 Tax=Mycobacterium sp. TaxID=1785 RepID=UPI003BA95436